MKFIRKNWRVWLIASLTLGLAPFNPPHILGKIQWVSGGAVGMETKDWFDLVFHGTPWVLLLTSFILMAVEKIKKR